MVFRLCDLPLSITAVIFPPLSLVTFNRLLQKGAYHRTRISSVCRFRALLGAYPAAQIIAQMLPAPADPLFRWLVGRFLSHFSDALRNLYVT